MRGNRFKFVHLFCLALLMMFFGVSSGMSQETFPTKPITIIVPWPPGGSSDIIARSFTEEASKLLGQPVVVINKGGGAGSVGINEAMTAKPDGYTLYSCVASTICHCALVPGTKWKVEDVQPILGNGIYSYAMVVHNDAPWKNFRDWVNYVKENSGFKYGSYGATGTNAVLMYWIAKKEGIKISHVPFQGDGPGMAAMLGGHVKMYGSSGNCYPHVKAGKLRVLLQMSGNPIPGVDQMSKLYPDAPLVLADLHIGVFGRKGIPEPALKKLTSVFRKACIENPVFRETNDRLFIQTDYQAPENLHRDIVEGTQVFKRLLTEMGHL
jgi:tripartite-type tricarboxylate transporter receptor subunit TctC